MSHHDLCPFCNQPWERQRHKTVHALAAFCYACAERKRGVLEYVAKQKHEALERRWKPYEHWTDEEKAQAEQVAQALWPKRE